MRFWPTMHCGKRQIDIICPKLHRTAGASAEVPAFCCWEWTLLPRREPARSIGQQMAATFDQAVKLFIVFRLRFSHCWCSCRRRTWHPFRTTVMIGWCLCLQCKSSEKSTSMQIIKWSLFHNIQVLCGSAHNQSAVQKILLLWETCEIHPVHKGLLFIVHHGLKK